MQVVVFDVPLHGKDGECYIECLKLMVVIECDEETDRCVMDVVHETMGCSDSNIAVHLRTLIYGSC